MPEAVDHPNPSELSAFSLGQLSLQQAEKIEEHISSCQTCCDTLLSLSSEDTFVGQLQEARHLAPAIPDSLDGTRGHHSLNEEAIPGPLASHPRYEIETLIGRGGMGQVYKAKHRMMDRAVALKVINREWVRRQEVIERFRREVKTAASLTHPNIVTAYDAEQAGDLHFLVMEYVDGKDLAQIVSERGPLPVAEACEYICKAAEGLQYAHERGMVHRDIKPHNLMVTRGNVVKILDFGLASLVPGSTPDEPLSEDADGNLTYAGAIMGTPDYISPEQAQDARNVDGRSDIYSLGMTLYYLLAGQVPFGEGSAMEKLKKHAEAEPASLESIRNDIPPALLAILSKMIAKDPNERFQSPAEVAAALESFAITVGHSPALQVASGEFSIGADDGGNNVDRNTASADKNWDPRVWWVWFGCLVAGIALAFFVLSLGFMETIIFIFVALILEKISEWMTRRKQTVHSLSSGDARLLQVSELLGVISLIPLAMLAYEWLNWTDATSLQAEQRMWMYGLTAFGLSTFGGVAYGTFKVKLLYPDVPVKPVLAFTFMTIITSCGFAFLYSKPHQSISFVAGGAGIDGNGWYVTSGNTYLKHDEPGVQFGMYEDPNGGRGFTYVILTRHAGSELAKVSSVSGADLIFDGETASMKDGLSIDGKGIELDLDLNVDRSRITSSALSVNGEKIDPSMGNLFLVDLTSDQVQWNQVKVEYPTELPAPKEVVSDTQLVSDLARQLTEHLARENKKVREFLAGEMPNTDLARQNGVHPSNRMGVAADPNFPTLQIMKVEGKSTDLGKDVQKIWKLQGRKMYGVTARIMHISEGETKTVYQTKLHFEDHSHTMLNGQLVLNSQDRPNDQVALSLDLSFGDKHGESKSGPVLFSKGFGRSSVSTETDWDGQHIDIDDIAFLATLTQYPANKQGSIQHRNEDIVSMKQASKQGAEFLLVMLMWEPVDEAARTDLPQSADGSIPEKQSDSGSKLELSSDLEENFFQTGQHREKFEAELSVALSYAAGIPNEQWEKVGRGESIETIQGSPLSWFLLMSAPEKSSPEEDLPAPLAFRQLTERTPKPLELHKAMAPSQRHGYVSIIQPEYITKIKLDFDRKEERFKGTVWFEAPELYAGQVDFSMFYHVGQMKVIEFDLPEFETKLIRNNELWEKQKQAGQDRVLIDLNTEIPLEDVRTAIRTFYVAKYPMFGALVEQSSKTLDTPEKLLQQETRRQIGELSIASPLTEVVNSFPGMPLVTFTEKTYLSNTELLETKVHLHHIGENSCRVVLSKKRRMTNADEEPALTAPVTAFDIRTLIQIVELTRTTTEAESDWADEQINNLIAKMMKGQMSKTEEPQKGSDQERIQGTWQVTYSEDSGRIAPQEMLKNLRFVFDQNTLTTEMGERKTVSNYTLNPQSKPKSIDITEGGRTKLGIYDLEGDTLRICFAENSEKRPTAFDSQPESANDVIIMLKRLSPRIEAIPETDEGANGSLQ